jgi:hypothetical protein
MILYLDEIAVGRRLGEAKNRPMIDPGMAGENAVCFARF